MTLRYLVERTGYSEKSLRLAISSLMQKGWLMKARPCHYGVNEYGIVEPNSIVGRFGSAEKTVEKITADLGETAVNITGENWKKLPLISEEITADLGETPYYIFDNNIYNNFFIPAVPEEKKEKEILLKEFFLDFGIYQPMDEVMSFWHYHEQTGWRNGKGQRIVNKQSAAKFWKISDAARRQQDWSKRFLGRMIPLLKDEERLCVIAELENMYREQENVVMKIQSDKIYKTIESNVSLHGKLARIMYDVCGAGTKLVYCK